MPSQEQASHVPKKKKKVKKMPRKLTEDDYDADANLDLSSPEVRRSRMSLIKEEDEAGGKYQPQDMGELPDLNLD